MNSRLEPPATAERQNDQRNPTPEDTTPRDGLVVRGLTVETRGHRRLDAVDFSMSPGSMVAVVGTSGAGKSTFVKAIAGYEPPTAGSVVLRDIDVGSSFDLMRGQIAYVPQDNILHESLTVRETLAFAAELRLPAESAQERAARCTSIISDLGLGHRADARVDALSGGQRKRVNVAVELLTTPVLLILDEPTSGLDPASERSMLQLLRRIADSGQMVIVVTHGMGDLDIFDRVFALASGGVPVFDGSPQSLHGFLGASDATDVFARLSELDDASSLRLPPRPRPPDERTPIVQPPPSLTQRIRRESDSEARRQLWVLARRYARVLRSDRRGLISLLLQAPILGIIMWAVFEPSLLGADDLWPVPPIEAGNVLVALVLASIYLGASNSVREIAKERTLLRREQSFGLSAFAYLASKFAVLGAITIVQSAVLVATATARQNGPVDPLLFPGGKLELIVLISLCGLGALSMGLLISALSRSSDRAMVVLPVVLFIQFMLAGVTFSISTPGIQQLSWLVIARWGFTGAASTIDYWNSRGCDAWTECDDLWQHSASHWLTAVAIVVVLALAMFAIAWWWLERSDPARVLSRSSATRSSSRAPVARPTTAATVRPPAITDTRPTESFHRAPSIAAPSIAAPSIAAPSIAAPSIAAPSIAAPSIAAPSIAYLSNRGPLEPMQDRVPPAPSPPPIPSPQPARSRGRLWPWLVLMFLIGVAVVLGAAVLIRPASTSADRDGSDPSPLTTESADDEEQAAADASGSFEELLADPGVDSYFGPVDLPDGDQMALLLRPGEFPVDEGSIDLAVQSAGDWSIVQNLPGDGNPHSPVALGDLDGDGFSEIKITSHPGGNKGFDNLLRVNPDGPSMQMLDWDTQSLALTIFGFTIDSISDGVVTTSVMTCEPSSAEDPGTVVDWELDDSGPVPTLRPIDYPG